METSLARRFTAHQVDDLPNHFIHVEGRPLQVGFLGECPQALEQLGRSPSIGNDVIQCLLHLLQLQGMPSSEIGAPPGHYSGSLPVDD